MMRILNLIRSFFRRTPYSHETSPKRIADRIYLFFCRKQILYFRKKMQFKHMYEEHLIKILWGFFALLTLPLFTLVILMILTDIWK